MAVDLSCRSLAQGPGIGQVLDGRHQICAPPRSELFAVGEAHGSQRREAGLP